MSQIDLEGPMTFGDATLDGPGCYIESGLSKEAYVHAAPFSADEFNIPLGTKGDLVAKNQTIKSVILRTVGDVIVFVQESD